MRVPYFGKVDSHISDDGILVYLDTEEFRTLFDWKRVVSEVPTEGILLRGVLVRGRKGRGQFIPLCLLMVS